MRISKLAAAVAQVAQVVQVVQLAKTAPAAEAPPKEDAYTTEVLWSDSVLYGTEDFPKYNPDNLIGVKGHKIYQKMMKDEQLKVALKFRRNAVTSRNWVFEFDESIAEELSEEERDLRIQVMTHALRRVPGSFKRGMNYVMKAVPQGFSITEKTLRSFKYRDQVWWGINKLSPKPFDTFYPVVNDQGELLRLEQDIGGRRQEVDLSKVVWYVVNPEEDEHYGQSELREAYRDWYSKDILIKLENIYLERMAGGLVWAESESGADPRKASLSPTDKTSLERVLSNIQTVTGIKMPVGWKLNVNNPVSTTAFKDAIDRHDRNLAKALLMPNLMGYTEQGGTGSYSQSKTNMEGFLWMLDADADDLAECLNEQLFQPLGDANWGDGLYPEFKLQPLSKEQLYSVFKVWNEMVSSGTVKPSPDDEDFVRELLGFPPRSEEDEDPGEDSIPLPGEGGEKEDPEEAGAAEVPEPDEGEEVQDETLLGKDLIAIEYAKFNRIQRRVDFAAIDRTTTLVEHVAEQDLGDTMAELAKHLADQVRENQALLTDPAEARKVKTPAAITASLKKQAKASLAEAWDVGVENAKRELEKAGLQRMSKAKFARFASVGDVATKYFEAKAFTMAGSLGDEALATFKVSVLNGIKYSKSVDEVVDDIYRTFATKGMISEDAVREILGKTLDVENPDHRLRTMIRTNNFDALNEARYSYFTDPELGGFVEALTYSAILDSRTTTICSALDDKVYALGSEVWERYRPPNHYNCRSLLVAVSRNDEVELTEQPPTVQPQEGFK